MDPFNPTGLDDYKPAEIARQVEEIGVRKAHMPALQLFTLAVLAGVFIGFGALAFTMVMTGADLQFGPARWLGGVVFSLGLILVIVGGAELFTGNALLMMALVDRRIGVGALLRNWGIVYAGNLVGALGLAGLVALAHLADGPMGETARKIALVKASLPLDQAFFRGILCNALVCLAVWLTISARSGAGKILAIVWPIATFVLLGLEHSVANMYLVPAGYLAGAPVTAWAFASTLAAVSLGNVVGGAGGVGLVYWLAYRPAREG